MKLPALIVGIVISANCACQDLENNMPGIIKEYLETRQADSGLKEISFTRGSVSVPKNCTNLRTGTIDSERGELSCGQLLINYDIGFMAGTHATEYNKNEFEWYDEKMINNNKAGIGLKKDADKWTIVITLRNADGDRRAEPANFWAQIKNANEVKRVINIVFSYKWKV